MRELPDFTELERLIRLSYQMHMYEIDNHEIIWFKIMPPKGLVKGYGFLHVKLTSEDDHEMPSYGWCEVRYQSLLDLSVEVTAHMYLDKLYEFIENWKKQILLHPPITMKG